MNEEYDFEARMRAARQRAPKQPPGSGRILSGAAFVARHKPPLWLIDGIIQRGRLYSCTSLTGHGKTAVWLYASCMIQAGRKFGQLETHQGNILYLAGENPSDVEARLLGMCRHYDIPRQDLPFVLPRAFPLNEDEADNLKKDVEALGVPLVGMVGDTAASFFPGDNENDNVQAGQYGRTLRRLTACPGNPAIIFQTHPIKNAGPDNLQPRGGSAFLNELDGDLNLWSESLGEVTQLSMGSKLRGPPFDPLDFRLEMVETGLSDETGRNEVTIVASPISEEEATAQVRRRLNEANLVLRALSEQPNISYAKIAENFGWLFVSGEPAKSRVQRLVTALAKDGLVSQRRKGGPWRLTNKGKDELSDTEK